MNTLMQLSTHICPKCKILMHQVNRLVQCEHCGHYEIQPAKPDVRHFAGEAISEEFKNNQNK